MYESRASGLRVLIAGCGRLGSSLGAVLAEQAHTVWGLRRRTDELPDEIQPLEGDLASGRGLSSLPPCLDYVFYTASSGSSSAEGYKAAYLTGVRNLLETLIKQQQTIRRVFFVSSTGVYSQQSGEWVDEDSPTCPRYSAGEYLLQGEDLIGSSPYPGTVVRLAGIYGPGRVRLLDRVARGKEACLQERTQYTNLIHSTDCVAILNHLMHLAEPSRLYIAADCEPTDRCILLHWLADQLNAPKPQTLPASHFSSRQLRSNKRCSSQRLLQSGYEFVYPTFRQGYISLVKDYQCP